VRDDRDIELGVIAWTMTSIAREQRGRHVSTIGDVLPGCLHDPLRIEAVVDAAVPDLEMQV
jgi:hypothetical protein